MTDSIQMERTRKFTVVVAAGDFERNNSGPTQLGQDLFGELIKLTTEDLIDLAEFLSDYLTKIPETYQLEHKNVTWLDSEGTHLIQRLDELDSFIRGIPILAEVWLTNGRDPRPMIIKIMPLEEQFVKAVQQLVSRNSLTASYAQSALANSPRGKTNKVFPWIRDLLPLLAR